MSPPTPPPTEPGLPARKPAWLKVPLPGGEGYARLKSLARELQLHTVCEEARCPNMGECWAGGHPTMTLMVLGDECTRMCRFCAVKTSPTPARPDPDEPRNVGKAVAAMGVGYVVITSVDRDDLEDGGAAHYAECVREVRRQSPGTVVETLIPDYAAAPLALLMEARPDVLAHNVEVVPRLQLKIRDTRCSFERVLPGRNLAIEQVHFREKDKRRRERGILTACFPQTGDRLVELAMFEAGDCFV